jgi:hypothetical protein
MYVKDMEIEPDYINKIYTESRKKYNRSSQEAKKEIIKEHKDVVEKLSDFSEPLI